MNEVSPEHLKELLELPSNNSSFKWYLDQASEVTIRAAIAGLDEGDVAKKKALERGLKKLLEATTGALKTTNDHHSGVLKMDVDTYEAERNDELQRDMDQCNREKRIAEAHEVIGRVQALSFIEKVTTVSSLVQLNKIKESKVYRDLPNIGTWEKYCDYLGWSRQKVDEDLRNLVTFGEGFLTT
ncbi:MAG: hypothetical protein PHY09_18380, partial [Desulfuromonadaceae bacterium]|nr:hypothetical protein [Desulfuromonadaceae bacterium]